MKLKEICEINPRMQGINDTMEVTFVPMPSVSEDGKIDVSEIRSYGDVKKGYTSFRERDVLFAKITPCMENGKGAVAQGLKNGIGCGSSEFHILRPMEELAKSEWIYYLTAWDKFRKEAAKHMTGSAGQRRVPKSYLENYEIKLPSISDQVYQINVLSRLQTIIDGQKKVFKILDELVKARFVELFGSISNNKFGYEVMALQDVCEPIKDGTHQTPTYTEDAINGYKFLSSKDVTSGKVNWNHLKYIPAELHNELYKRISPRKGDILLAKNGTTGVAAIVDRDDIFDIYVSLALLRPLSMVTSEYLCSAVNSVETKHQFDNSLKGIGVPNLHLGEIKKTKIVVPPIEVQEQFAEFVKQVDKSKLLVFVIIAFIKSRNLQHRFYLRLL